MTFKIWIVLALVTCMGSVSCNKKQKSRTGIRASNAVQPEASKTGAQENESQEQKDKREAEEKAAREKSAAENAKEKGAGTADDSATAGGTKPATEQNQETFATVNNGPAKKASGKGDLQSTTSDATAVAAQAAEQAAAEAAKKAEEAKKAEAEKAELAKKAAADLRAKQAKEAADKKAAGSGKAPATGSAVAAQEPLVDESGEPVEAPVAPQDADLAAANARLEQEKEQNDIFRCEDGVKTDSSGMFAGLPFEQSKVNICTGDLVWDKISKENLEKHNRQLVCKPDAGPLYTDGYNDGLMQKYVATEMPAVMKDKQELAKASLIFRSSISNVQVGNDKSKSKLILKLTRDFVDANKKTTSETFVFEQDASNSSIEKFTMAQTNKSTRNHRALGACYKAKSETGCSRLVFTVYELNEKKEVKALAFIIHRYGDALVSPVKSSGTSELANMVRDAAGNTCIKVSERIMNRTYKMNGCMAKGILEECKKSEVKSDSKQIFLLSTWAVVLGKSGFELKMWSGDTEPRLTIAGPLVISKYVKASSKTDKGQAMGTGLLSICGSKSTIQGGQYVDDGTRNDKCLAVGKTINTAVMVANDGAGTLRLELVAGKESVEFNASAILPYLEIEKDGKVVTEPVTVAKPNAKTSKGSVAQAAEEPEVEEADGAVSEASGAKVAAQAPAKAATKPAKKAAAKPVAKASPSATKQAGSISPSQSAAAVPSKPTATSTSTTKVKCKFGQMRIGNVCRDRDSR